MSSIGGLTPGAPPPPATRTLSVVLREALAKGEEVRMLVAKGLPDSANPLPNAAAYMNVELEGQTVTVPKVAGAGLGGSASGYAVYVFATPDFLLAVGTVATGGGAAQAGQIPVGGIIEWPTNNIPGGWLRCDGSSFAPLTYPDLYNALGSNILPDYRRRVLVGAGSGGYSIGNGDGQAEGARGIAHHHHVGMVTSVVGDHTHGAAGQHNHPAPAGQYWSVTGLGLTGGAGTARYVTADGLSTTTDAGQHQHPAAGQHQHGIDGDTSGGGAQDAPSWTVVQFIIRAL